MVSHIGKRVESKVWYHHLKENFFEKRGYQLIGDPQFVWEHDQEIDVHDLGYKRALEAFDVRKYYEEKYLK